MLRKPLIERSVAIEKDFRWRGGEVSRIEGFTDAVFAFAVTLLAVNLEVPSTFDELQSRVLNNFLSFGITFLMLMLVWVWHYRFFRRFGLQDNFTLIVNVVLLFVILFYVYFLKFTFTLLVGELQSGAEPLVTLPDGKVVPMIEPGQGNTLLVIYGLGFIAVHLIFALLYFHAYRQREQLELTSIEQEKTQDSVRYFVALATIGLASVLAAALGFGWAGLIYMLIAPVLTILGTVTGVRRRKRDEAELARTGGFSGKP